MPLRRAAGEAMTGPAGRDRCTVAVRDAAVDDLPRLLEIEAGFPGDRLSRRQFVHHLRRGAPLRVIEDCGGVAGYYLLLRRPGSRQVRLYSIAVDAARRGRGLGDRLLTDAERCASDLGGQRLTLEVREDNAAAIALYRAHGFIVAGRRERYYQDGQHALCLQRPLVAAGA